MCTSVKPRAAEEPCWSVTENCTPDPVSAERLSFLTEWRTEGKAGRQEEEEESGGGAAEAGGRGHGLGAAAVWTGCSLMPVLAPQFTERQE
ncbi:hypothetical protein CgunFtcFv8_013308 [Champsocephalus gunnari]|uniref:Uncharacterized protein n=1 Tax=Champsocephalus gunnari TaxID=52237 RepID=A0AAN8DX33_CHAGU|nr:hypothetical protein CgunFtcFv8_013308 [Champsocephalus gunnari]